MAYRLKRYSADQVAINDAEARKILMFFFGQMPQGALTYDDRSFAQALIVEAIERSYAMGFIESLIRSLAKLPQGLGAFIKDFAKRSVVHWTRHVTQKEVLDDPKLYQAVCDTIRIRFKSVWGVRVATGELIY